MNESKYGPIECAKTYCHKFLHPFLKSYPKATLWNMETTSKLWDLNYEVESLEKVNFLPIRVHKITSSRKIEKDYLSWYRNKGGDAPNSVFDPISN